VGVVEAARHVEADRHRDLHRQDVGDATRLLHHVVERAAVDVLHGDVELAARSTHLVDMDDVRMAEADRDARLVAEQLAEVRVAGQLRPDALERDAAGESLLAVFPAEEHIPHPPRAETANRRVAAGQRSLSVDVAADPQPTQGYGDGRSR
jgi:hypothetical protein